MRATWERTIGKDLNPITVGVGVTEDVTPTEVRLRIPTLDALLVLDMADLDRLRAKVLAARGPVAAIDPDKMGEPELGEAGA